ncbi:hypothetical protein A8W25_04945 [Streptomyces sp. ERV7]|uniref:hypothetical protein n=1 Tax=Streptomyces sp. ERV7 TaxID=1322334 RepID=UPI0007F3411F|nr:hypothetical protein [Streptomyces sp. ERV7]OAR27579.1 hypothetical protein A8W25_04945 [Streptomyces sp. ERV7]
MTAGAALAVSAAGAVLAYIPLDSPLRAPLALFFLIAAPAEALVFALRRLEPLARIAASFSGALLIDLVIAEIMARAHVRSLRGEIIAVALISFLLFLAGTGVNNSASDRSRKVKNPKT